ncbi:MAG: prepilin-type N-terminal cleavage/methylation domain-containing protein [Candidatus Andersenbacteria bacterium]|nr:prepilin-type N-terminal cleavage/methylation domain-containing protein [Candidatus Andersenbacteria bacterium]
MNRPYYNRGFTLLETVIGLGIAGLLFAALATFFGSGISSNRFQFEQLLTTDSARFAFERLVTDIRAAQTGPNGEDWLVEAGEYHLIFYANVDADAGVERVRYSLAGSDLSRGVLQAGETEEEVSVYHNIRNVAPTYPVFSYYGEQATFIPAAEVTSEAVVSIFVQLIIDVNQGQQPGPAVLETMVTPRLLRSTSGPSTARLNPVTLDYPADYSSSTNVEVEIFYPATSITAVQTWPIPTVNSRLTTYSGEKVNINYQALTVGSFLPDWYVWVGPILVGQSGEQKYYVTKQLRVSDVCLGQALADLLATCPAQTATYGTFSKQFQPILLYNGSGYQDYVKAITFTYNPVPPPPPAPTPPPLVAYYKFDENNSTTATDSSGHGYNGSMNQGLGNSNNWSTTDKAPLNFTNVSALIDFDGSNDNITFSNFPELHNPALDIYSLSLWLKSSSSAAQILILGDPYGEGSGDEGHVNSLLLRDGFLAFINDGGSECLSSVLVNNGAWRHIALVAEPGASATTLTFYIDGVASGGCSVPTSQTSNPLFVSSEPHTFGVNYENENEFDGSIDDLRYYNGVLTTAHVQALAAGNEP